MNKKERKFRIVWIDDRTCEIAIQEFKGLFFKRWVTIKKCIFLSSAKLYIDRLRNPVIWESGMDEEQK